ncbi:MAG: 50S ribosomal protein L23 [Deltaproteobacteria bacterium]|jgi:large subunit ribosomal protein L23|nr:50S ribosomal protein L23 [Deltaproteobacteria bacterium]
MKNAHDILLRPMVTEKSLKAREAQNKYSFEVDPRANKIEIRNAVEKLFDLTDKVLTVQTVNVAGKFKRRGRRGGYRSDWKKAIVTLVKGATIPIFEEG